MKKFWTLFTILSLAAVCFGFAATADTVRGQGNVANAAKAGAQASSLPAQTVVSERYEPSSSQTLGWTDAHADACAHNRDVCLKGCDGATSCSNQCWTNYYACMKQNQ